MLLPYYIFGFLDFITFIDVPAPTIKEDGEYPDWLFKLTEKDFTLNQLTTKMEEEGVMALDKREMMRAKRMITLKDIKEANATTSSV